MFSTRVLFCLVLLAGGITLAIAAPVPPTPCTDSDCYDRKGPFMGKFMAPLATTPCWEYLDPTCNNCPGDRSDQYCKKTVEVRKRCLEVRKTPQDPIDLVDGVTTRYDVVPGAGMEGQEPCSEVCKYNSKSKEATRVKGAKLDNATTVVRLVCKDPPPANPGG